MAERFPLVSVAVASFNNASYIIETLDSIAQQDYLNWELIVVDDCSTDDSVAVIAQWLNEHPGTPAQLITKEKNAGISNSFNLAVAAAKGKYFASIGSDDLFAPNKLSVQVSALEQLGDDYALVYGDIINIDEFGRVLNDGRSVLGDHPRYEGSVYTELLTGNFIPAMGQTMRLQAVKDLGGFDESIIIEDWDFWLRLAQRYKVKFVPGVVAEYRLHARSVSHQRQQKLAESTLALLSKHVGQSKELDSIVAGHFARYAETLAWYENPQTIYWLERTLQLKFFPKILAQLWLYRLGLTLPKLHKVYRQILPRKQAL